MLATTTREAGVPFRPRARMIDRCHNTTTPIKHQWKFSKTLMTLSSSPRLISRNVITKLTTFKTHAGLWRYKRFPYGAFVGYETCQHVIGQVLEGLPNARNIADDILVHGTTKEEHDKSLDSTLLRLHEKNVQSIQCLFGVTEPDYYGFLSTRGINCSVGSDFSGFLSIRGIP